MATTSLSTSKPNSSLVQHLSPVKSSSTSSISSMKPKSLIHTLIFSHICRMARAISKAKSMLANILKDMELIDYLVHFKKGGKQNKYHHKVKVYGSFRLHYNWSSSSSHVLPEPGLDKFISSQFYYDSTWNSVISSDHQAVNNKDGGADSDPLGLSGYLQWLEEKPAADPTQNVQGAGGDPNEIDKLADVFIANCHEKFRLEKQESYRRFQEMMARSM